MGCPPVRGDNPQALASGLSHVQVDKHGIIISYNLHLCRSCTFCADVGNGGIKRFSQLKNSKIEQPQSHHVTTFKGAMMLTTVCLAPNSICDQITTYL